MFEMQAGSFGNGTDLNEVWAIDSSRGNMTRLADLPEAKFGLNLVSLPGGDVLAVAGAQHINDSEAPLPFFQPLHPFDHIHLQILDVASVWNPSQSIIQDGAAQAISLEGTANFLPLFCSPYRQGHFTVKDK